MCVVANIICVDIDRSRCLVRSNHQRYCRQACQNTLEVLDSEHWPGRQRLAVERVVPSHNAQQEIIIDVNTVELVLRWTARFPKLLNI